MGVSLVYHSKFPAKKQGRTFPNDSATAQKRCADKSIKAVRLSRHVLSVRLRKVLDTVDGIHTATGLKQVAVVMNPVVQGAAFDTYTGTGPYTIYLNPIGSHPELSLLHEIGHFLEWQAIPKASFGQRSFRNDSLLTPWLLAVRASRNVDRLFDLRDNQVEDSSTYQAINYLLDEQELWAKSYSQYVAARKQIPVLLQHIAAENKVFTGNIQFKPYWQDSDFLSMQAAIEAIFQKLN